MKPGCGYCGGPLYRGVCMTGHANRRDRDNHRRKSFISNELKREVTSYELQWRAIYISSHDNPTRTAQWRPVIVASNGVERMPPHLPGGVTRY